MNIQTLPVGYRSESIAYKQHDYTNSVIETRSFNMQRMSFQQIADEETKKLKERDAVIKAEKARLKATRPVHISAVPKEEPELPVKVESKPVVAKLRLPSDPKSGGKTKKSQVREMLESHSCTIEHIAAVLNVSKSAATSLISDLKHDRVPVQSIKGRGTTVYFIEVEPDSTYSDRVHDTAYHLCEENPLLGYENAIARAMEIEPRRMV